MSTATLPAVAPTAPPPSAPAATLSPETLERLVIGGDLSKLSPGQRLEFYRARCDAAGLDPRTQPFQYITLQGKLTLYATKTATDQLTGLHRLSVKVVERKLMTEQGLMVVSCTARFPDGHEVDDVGVVSINGLLGPDLANAMMKCVTKAKRRTVLSACGLGMLDESEVEDAGPQRAHVDPEVASVPQRVIREFEEWLKKTVKDANIRWIDRVQDHNTGMVPLGLEELINSFKLCNHLLKWAVADGLSPEVVEGNWSTRMKACARVWLEHASKVRAEVAAYLERLAAEALAEQGEAFEPEME